tara:strand:- start:921 stop:1082 length:162 start_codon:yes stop_codon:yes gene_type:complete
MKKASAKMRRKAKVKFCRELNRMSQQFQSKSHSAKRRSNSDNKRSDDKNTNSK